MQGPHYASEDVQVTAAPAMPAGRTSVVNSVRQRLTANTLGWLAFLLLLTTYAVVALTHLQGLHWDFDEGIAVSQGWLILDGFRMYDPIWTDHSPGQPLLIAEAFRLAGVSLQSARAVTVFHAVLGLFAVGWAARVLTRRLGALPGIAWLGGLSAAAMLALAPNFWWASRTAMKGIMTFSLAALAMALALSYSETKKSAWLALASLALGLSLWEKIQMFYLAPVLALLVVWVRLERPWRRSLIPILRDLAILAAGPVVFLGATLLVFPTQAAIDQIWGTYQATRDAYGVDLPGNLEILRGWLLADNWGLLALALTGAVILILRPFRSGIITLTWFALTLVTPLQHGAVSVKDHFEPVLFPMTILTGVAVGYVASAVQGRLRRGRTANRTESRRVWLVGVAVLGCVVYLASLPHVLTVDYSLRVARTYLNTGEAPDLTDGDIRVLIEGRGRTKKIFDFIRTYSEPDDFILTDDQLTIFEAGRRVPPELAAASSRRIYIGELDGEDIIAAAEQVNPPVIIFVGDKLVRGRVEQWINERYYVATGFGDNKVTGYLRKDIEMPTPTPEPPSASTP